MAGRIGQAIETNAAASPATSGVSASRPDVERSSGVKDIKALSSADGFERSDVEPAAALASPPASRGVRGVRVRRRKKRRELRRHEWVHGTKVAAYYIFCLLVSAGVAYGCVHAREARTVLHSE